MLVTSLWRHRSWPAFEKSTAQHKFAIDYDKKRIKSISLTSFEKKNTILSATQKKNPPNVFLDASYSRPRIENSAPTSMVSSSIMPFQMIPGATYFDLIKLLVEIRPTWSQSVIFIRINLLRIRQLVCSYCKVCRSSSICVVLPLVKIWVRICLQVMGPINLKFSASLF